MRIKLSSPVKASSAGTSDPCTITDLEITRGRDRSWQRQDNVLYLTAYTSNGRAERGQSALIVALDYADVETLIAKLTEEQRLEREHRARMQQCGDLLDSTDTHGPRCIRAKGHTEAHGDGRGRRWT